MINIGIKKNRLKWKTNQLINWIGNETSFESLEYFIKWNCRIEIKN